MKLQSITLNSIRNFDSQIEFNFSETLSLNTISGANGSGKTTLFKCISICQKAFFAIQKTAEQHIREISIELSKYFTSKDSSIEVKFQFDDSLPDEKYGFKIVCLDYRHNFVEWELKIDDNDKEKVLNHWNIDNPRNIIIYIDSNKHFLEHDVTHDNISINSSYTHLILETIFSPEKIFSNIYQRLIGDYLKERLVPSKPKKDIYLLPTKIFLKELIPNIHFSNFSGQQFENQFVYLGKTSNKTRNNFYDVRNFSSGEKSLFYILLFLNYVENVGMLVIDEPENNFHEDLLIKFVRLISQICNDTNYSNYIKQAAKRTGTPLSKRNVIELEKYYKNYSLSQVFLLTHSKNLIFSNFSNGVNFYINNSLAKIEYDAFEKTLREIGISSIYSKVLFVEGSGDTDFLDSFLNEHNIRVHPLNGCGSVIETYKKILSIKQYLLDSHFCFLIDRDTRTNDDIEKIRLKNEKYFDAHFMVLDKHEFENYFLTSEIYKFIIDKHASQVDGITKLEKEEIDKIIYTIATSKKEMVIKKALQFINQQGIDSIKAELIKKDIPINSAEEYNAYFTDKLTKMDIIEKLKNIFVSNYDDCIQKYNNENWAKNWISLCDGKTVLNLTIAHFAKHVDINPDRMRREIKDLVLQKGTLEINKKINEVINMFKATAK